MRASRLFSVPAFRFSIVDPKSAVGKWSRIATFGPKSKDGAEMMFDATTLGQMVDNAAARGDRIAIDNDHASAYPETRDAPALGFFGALAVVAGGQVVKAWNGSPDPAGLDDGLYGRLDEITPRGADPLVGLANYRTMSPMFVEEGTDEQNRPIGYALLNVAATNIPFQSGAEIMFFGVPAQEATAMADRNLVVTKSVADWLRGYVAPMTASERERVIKERIRGYWHANLLDELAGAVQVAKEYGISNQMATAASQINGATAMAQESRGHIAWLDGGQREAYEQGGEVYVAPTYAPLGPNGYRQGGRWESSRNHWDRYFEAVHKSRVSTAPSLSTAAAPAEGETTMAEVGQKVRCPDCQQTVPVVAGWKVAEHTRYDGGANSHCSGSGRDASQRPSYSAAAPANGATALGWNASLKPGDKIRDNRTGKVGTVKAIQRDGAAEVWWDSVDHGLIMPQGEPPPDLEKLSQSNPGAARAFQGASTMGLKFYVGDKVKTNVNGGDTGVVTDVSGGYVTIDWDRVGIENYSERELAGGRHITKMSTDAARAFQGASMNPEMMQKIGLADGCSPQDKMAKYSAYAMGDASPEELKAMADDLDKLDDPSAKSMAAKMRKFALPFEGKETPEEEKAEAGKLAALARTLGVPPTVAAIEAAVVPMSQFSALQSRLATIEAERAAEKKAAADRKVSELVDRAVAGGYPADQKDALTRFARADFGGAEALVARHVSQNATLFTSVSRGRGSSSPSASGSDVVERGAIVSFGQNLADAIKAHRKAHPKMSYEDAAAEVAAARPELAASYLSYGRQ